MGERSSNPGVCQSSRSLLARKTLNDAIIIGCICSKPRHGRLIPLNRSFTRHARLRKANINPCAYRACSVREKKAGRREAGGGCSEDGERLPQNETTVSRSLLGSLIILGSARTSGIPVHRDQEEGRS